MHGNGDNLLSEKLGEKKKTHGGTQWYGEQIDQCNKDHLDE